ncbi:PaaI family thioesterase [Desulfobulbus oligotrophicus]|jgi:acyl-coenzyme A thioesterase PaaI-like protein|uniref:PaaI family thioesterase n=1 Tax=Desulfobulbus oligotrophicus TaxID=1909699 RepID=A0A7T5VCX6_9BACT|nr:PaaI family thioesterase [Desulfobulbus oligotrophicus]MDY0391364.1 PaaI family thioesterase [Desulfobulbus oligotrophicus]QQG65610.1 PaaI family thioesterase [Desulfobulbus oligotrophicus]
MSKQAFQDQYPAEYAHCFGCGRLNPHGFHLKSYWDGEETVCRFTPGPEYTGGVPGNLYGGLIASLFDCHGAGTAAAAKSREDRKPLSRFVTASLHVDFLLPTPINTELEIRGKVREIRGRKVTVELVLIAQGTTCATGMAVMVQMKNPDI